MLTCRESVNKFKKDIVDFLYNWVKEEVYYHKQSSWKLQNTVNNTCMKTIRAAPLKHQLGTGSLHLTCQLASINNRSQGTVLNMSIPSSKCPESPAQKVLTR